MLQHRLGTNRIILALAVALLMGGLALFSATDFRSVVHLPRRVGDNHSFKPTSGPVISSPIAWDLNGDGTKEIAVGAWDGFFYVLDRELNDLAGWPLYSPGGYFSSPALADLDTDGNVEIIVGSEAGKLYAWHASGEDVPGFPVNLRYKLWASPTILTCPDRDVAAGPCIAIGTNQHMFLLGSDGSTVAGWPQPIHGWPDATAAQAPGLLAVTTLTPGDRSQGWLYAWHTTGGLLSGFPVELPLDSDSSPALADLDNNGNYWIVFGDDAGWLHVTDTKGVERRGFPVRTLGPKPGLKPTPHPPGGNIYSIESSPAVADLDDDGRLDIAAGSWDGRMYVWNDSGQSLPGWPVQVQDQIISSAALVDLDDDDRLDIVVGSKDGHLYGWTPDGLALPGFPYDLDAHVFSSPWVGDLEDDGRADIVVGADNGIHLLRDVGPLGRQAWPMFHRDAYHTGTVP